MNFATLKGLTIPEGAVKKIEDASGVTLWGLSSGVPTAILYSDGALVFQTNGKADSSHGTVVNTYTGWDTETYNSYSFCPWYADKASITSVMMPNAVAVKSTSSWFDGYSALTYAEFHGLTTLSPHMFNKCSGLTVVNFPLATLIDSYAFAKCTSLTSVTFPATTSTGSYVFQDCTALKTLDFHAAVYLGGYALSGCSALTALILRSATTSSLSMPMVLQNTPIASGTGYIYVPRNLVDTYKTASLWSNYAAQFRALEDYTVDGTIIGALDETKI